MTTEADLSTAGTRLYGDADSLIALARTIKGDRGVVAQTVAQDRAAALAAAVRAEAALASIAGGTTGGGGSTGGTGGTIIAQEGDNFTVPDNTPVRFGIADNYVEMTFSGAHVCNLPTFGTDVDPAPNQVKVCRIGPF